MVLETKRAGSNEPSKTTVLSFAEPADQVDMFQVLKRNIAANWGIAAQKISKVTSGDVVIEDDSDVFQLQARDVIEFSTDN